MDFLTQPFAAPPPHTAEPPRAQAHPAADPSAPSSPTQSASSVFPTAAGAAPVDHQRASDNASLSPSFSTSSTADTTTALEQTAARFATLRTVDPATAADALPDEPVVRLSGPGKGGDWLAYGRVKAQVVLWPEGTVGANPSGGGGGGVKKLREREGDEEWVVEGTLWITQKNEIVLVLNRDKSPVQVDRGSKVRTVSSGRRLSIGSLGRSISRESGERPRPSSSESTRGVGAEDDAQPEHKGGLSGFMKKVVAAVVPGKSLRAGETGSADDEGVSLTRTRTGERTPRTAASGGRATTGATPPARLSGEDPSSGRAGLTFEEPVKTPSPLPTYKGHIVTALYIGSPSFIHSVRFYPHRKVNRSTFGAGSKEAPISSAPGPAAPKDENGRAADSDDVLLVQAPVVELDLLAKDRASEPGMDEGKKREVTVGFVFKDILLMNEAETFRQRVEALLHSSSSSASETAAESAGPSSGGTGGFGSALLRTMSGKGGGSTTGTHSSPAGAAGGTAPLAPAVASAGPGVEPGDVEGETGERVRPAGPQRRRGSSFFKGFQKDDVWV